MKKEKQKMFFGISMKKYSLAHEAYVQEILKGEENLEDLLNCHDKKISWLQHERLIHLIVTALTGIFFIFSIVLFSQTDGSLAGFLVLLYMTILFVAYVHHYFILENRVQHWYQLYDEINGKIKDGAKK